jgi:hypothetical protein
MKLEWDDKDPDEVLDYQLDWTARLQSETIATSVWMIDSTALVQNSSSFTITMTTVWLSAGVDGETYELTNRITTTGNRTMDQTVKLKVKSR